MKRTNEMKKNNKGFSLVELIIVIAIMAVLVGIVAPQFLGYVQKSKQSTDIQNAQQLATEIAVKIAANEGAGDALPATEGYVEITPSVVSSVPSVKLNTAHKFYYMIDTNKIVHIAIAASAPTGTDISASDVYPEVKNTAYLPKSNE